MAVYQSKPINMYPDYNTLDATQAIGFTWTPQGASQYGYQLVIYNQSLATPAIVYDSGVVVSTDEFKILPAATLSNGNYYSWAIRVYANVTDYINSDFLIFKTSAVPVVTLASTPNNVQNYTFQLIYTLASGVSFKKYRYTLYDSNGAVVEDTGDVYDPNATYSATGLVSGATYTIIGYVTDQNDLIGNTGLISFITNYTSPNGISLLTATADDINGDVQLDFTLIKLITGTITGTSSYVSGKFGQGLLLNSGAYVTFTEDIPVGFSDMFWWKPSSTSFTGSIAIFRDFNAQDYIIGYDYSNQRFYYNYKGIRIVMGNIIALDNSVFYKIYVQHCKVLIEYNGTIIDSIE